MSYRTFYRQLFRSLCADALLRMHALEKVKWAGGGDAASTVKTSWEATNVTDLSDDADMYSR